jgi:hypothetical protein
VFELDSLKIEGAMMGSVDVFLTVFSGLTY